MRKYDPNEVKNEYEVTIIIPNWGYDFDKTSSASVRGMRYRLINGYDHYYFHNVRAKNITGAIGIVLKSFKEHSIVFDPDDEDVIVQVTDINDFLTIPEILEREAEYE